VLLGKKGKRNKRLGNRTSQREFEKGKLQGMKEIQDVSKRREKKKGNNGRDTVKTRKWGGPAQLKRRGRERKSQNTVNAESGGMDRVEGGKGGRDCCNGGLA